MNRATMRSEARWVAQEASFFTDGPFRASVSPTGASNVLVVTGENASGKSLLARLLAASAKENYGWTVRSLSIRERAGGGMGSFMYLEESSSSTGTSSFSTLRNAMENQLDRPEGTVLILDEPELGLSEGYAGAMGEYIGTRLSHLPKACHGVVVVTHSRPLVGGLLHTAPKRPTHVEVGTATPGGLDRWLAEPQRHTVADLVALEETALERMRWTAKALRTAGS